MIVEVLKAFRGGDAPEGILFQPGEIIDAAGWKLLGQLLAQRYVRPVTIQGETSGSLQERVQSLELAVRQLQKHTGLTQEIMVQERDGIVQEIEPPKKRRGRPKGWRKAQSEAAPSAEEVIHEA